MQCFKNALLVGQEQFFLIIAISSFILLADLFNAFV